MNKLGISIIIPCYNAGQFLIETVNSILVQPFRYPFEIIIIDDGSTDKNTSLALKKIGGRTNANIKIIKTSQNKGAQYARNVGLKSANFDYIFTIDADDILNTETDILEKGTYSDRAIDILNSSPDVAFVHGMTQMFGDYAGLTISAYPATESLILEKHHAQISIVCRKQDALNAGLYDETIKKWQDWSFAVGILNHRFLSGKKNNIEFLPFPYYLYRIHSKKQRISSEQINEKEMIRKTFLRHPEIFRNYYNDTLDDDIVDIVFSKKPDKLKDLLYIAKDNLNRAFEIASHREFSIIAKNEPYNMP